MPYLNVRERRIEAKVAYIGADGAGKKTNFEVLRKQRASRADDGDRLTFEHEPAGNRFRDCAVQVTVFAGEAAAARDADGVVLVIDASPEAAERNRAVIGRLREALAELGGDAPPVVAQINKLDLANGESPDVLAAALELDAFPRVGATATTGDGVVEALARVVDEVLADVAIEPPASVTHERAATQNPLLAALQRVLRETMTEHADARADALSTRLEAIERGLAAQAEAIEEIRATLGALGDRSKSKKGWFG